MQALIDLRRRIRSVKNTQKITQAMRTVSTAKFKKAQRTVLEKRPFWHSSADLLSWLASWAEESVSPLLVGREEKKIEAVVITSDKGLCGAFNSNLLTQALAFFKEKSKMADVRLVLVGKKATNFFKKQAFPVDHAYSDKINKLSAEDLRKLARFLMRLYTFNRIDAVYVAYNEFKSILSPSITVTRLLPLPLPKKEAAPAAAYPDWEPEAAALLDRLIPLYMEGQISHCFYESLAAEQAARMMAMENATKNAEDMIADLILILNKIRQTSITKELLEIMTAVEALAK